MWWGGGGMLMWVQSPWRPEVSEPLGLELKAVVSDLIRILGTKLSSSLTTASTLNH